MRTRYDGVVADSTTPEELLDSFAAKLVETLQVEAPMHRLWYDLRTQSMFEETLREAVLMIDQNLQDMIWRVVTRYAELAERSRPSTSPAWRVLDGLFQQALLGLPLRRRDHDHQSCLQYDRVTQILRVRAQQELSPTSYKPRFTRATGRMTSRPTSAPSTSVCGGRCSVPVSTDGRSAHTEEQRALVDLQVGGSIPEVHYDEQVAAAHREDPVLLVGGAGDGAERGVRERGLVRRSSASRRYAASSCACRPPVLSDQSSLERERRRVLRVGHVGRVPARAANSAPALGGRAASSGSGWQVKNCHGVAAAHSSPMNSIGVNGGQRQQRRADAAGRGEQRSEIRSPVARLPIWSWFCR